MGITLSTTGAFRETGRSSLFFVPKGALTHHLPAGQAVVAFPLVRPCALRGGLRSLRRAPDNAAETAVPIIIVCAKGSVRRSLRLRKPATGSFVAEAGSDMFGRPCILFHERESERIGGENDWPFTIWRRRSSAEGQVVLPARLRLT